MSTLDFFSPLEDIQRRETRARELLCEKSLNLKTISQGDFGHFRENHLIIHSKVAKIALKIVFKFKLFSYKLSLFLARELSLVRALARKRPHASRFTNASRWPQPGQRDSLHSHGWTGVPHLQENASP